MATTGQYLVGLSSLTPCENADENFIKRQMAILIDGMMRIRDERIASIPSDAPGSNEIIKHLEETVHTACNHVRTAAMWCIMGATMPLEMAP